MKLGLQIPDFTTPESRGLGIPFPPVAERFERLEETLQICLQMWRGDEPVSRQALLA